MNKSTSEATGGGVSFLGCLALLFIGLKLGRVIDWPWLWVLAPLWGPLGLVLCIVSTAAVVAVTVFIFGATFYLLPIFLYEAWRKHRARREHP